MRLKLGGIALTIGGILFFVRMGPVFARMPENIPFPPDNTEGLAQLAAAVEGAWPLSHALGLVAALLIVFGYWNHALVLAQNGPARVAKTGASVATLAFGLFCAALVIDGFIVYPAALAHVAAPSPVTEALVEQRHDLALMFFTPGVFLMFVAMVLLASRMIHREIHSRWMGFLGQGIGIIAITFYLLGLAGPNWDVMQVGGSLMLFAFIWHIVVGLAATFGRGVQPDVS